jgi:hypothetical protein
MGFITQHGNREIVSGWITSYLDTLRELSGKEAKDPAAIKAVAFLKKLAEEAYIKGRGDVWIPEPTLGRYPGLRDIPFSEVKTAIRKGANKATRERAWEAAKQRLVPVNRLQPQESSEEAKLQRILETKIPGEFHTSLELIEALGLDPGDPLYQSILYTFPPAIGKKSPMQLEREGELDLSRPSGSVFPVSLVYPDLGVGEGLTMRRFALVKEKEPVIGYPFVSEAQRKWMHINKPRMAEEWEQHTPKGKKLPKHVKKQYAVLYQEVAAAPKSPPKSPPGIYACPECQSAVVAWHTETDEYKTKCPKCGAQMERVAAYALAPITAARNLSRRWQRLSWPMRAAIKAGAGSAALSGAFYLGKSAATKGKRLTDQQLLILEHVMPGFGLGYTKGKEGRRGKMQSHEESLAYQDGFLANLGEKARMGVFHIKRALGGLAELAKEELVPAARRGLMLGALSSVHQETGLLPGVTVDGVPLRRVGLDRKLEDIPGWKIERVARALGEKIQGLEAGSAERIALEKLQGSLRGEQIAREALV